MRDKDRGVGGDRDLPVVRDGAPVIDRMSDLLELLERRPAGVTIRELTHSLLLPRSTVYRCLNTLESHGIVRRIASGAYRLGPRLLALAAKVAAVPEEQRLAAFAQPHLDRLAATTGEGCKLSVLAGDRALVAAVGHGGSGDGVAVSVVAGRTFPLHAGAASKLLIAHLPAEEASALLGTSLPSLTRATVTDRGRLLAELAGIRRRGYALDRGEYVGSVHALAVPVCDGTGRVIAALSMPFLADAGARRRVVLRAALRAEALRLSSALAATTPRSSRAAAA